MQLPNDLIAQFAKLASGSETREPQIKTLYGTITGKGKQVLIDGSSAPTPITFDDDSSASTVNVKDGDRVLLQVKNHSVVITGNITDPSIGSNTDIQTGTSESGEIETTKITNLGIVMADKIQTEVATVNKLVADEISAVDAEIINLKAKNVEITGTLTATNAEITNLKTSHLEVTGNLEAVNAEIINLKATDADFRTLESDYATFTETTTESLKAQVADINKLKTDKLDAETADITYAKIDDLDATYAKIVDLNATNADVDKLDAGIADINTLIFGSASGEVIQTEFANAVIAQLGNAQIKAAMIQNIDADQINAGDISTNKMRVVSDDGKLVISDETIQISDDNRVRVQIGKDSSNDYSINIWDESGNLMFSKGGITDKAIKDAIIRNDMVSDDANISASKLNISSLFTEINNSTETIKSTKIYLDDEKQTLDVAFTQMSSDLDDTKETVSSQGTQLSVIQGKIESKVWQQDINDATGDLSTRLSTVEQDINGITTTVGSHTTQINEVKNTADQNAVDLTNVVNSFNKDVENLQTQIDGSITTWFYEVVPTNSNAPASGWDTTELKNNHLGDLYYDTITGYCYRWQVQNNTYSWQRITDTDVTKALADAAAAQDTADQKRRVFYSQPTTPYEAGDLWVQGDGGDILRCKTPKTGSQSYSLSDWILASKYTDDTAADAAQQAADKAQSDVDKLSVRVTTSETKIEQNSEQIALRATKTEVENIEIGGRNLLLRTDLSLTGSPTEDFTTQQISRNYSFSPDIANDPKAFLLSIKDSYLSFSYDIEVDEIYANPSLSQNRVGGYFTFNLTNTETGKTTAWYGTHSHYISAGNNTLGRANSLTNIGADITSFVGHYASYCDMSNCGSTFKDFYENPDKYTVTATHAIVQIRGFTKGGTIKNVKLEIGNKPTRWTPAPEDMATAANVDSLSKKVTTAETNIKQNADSITSVATRTTAVENKFGNYSTTEQMNSAIEQNANSITATVSATYATKTEAVITPQIIGNQTRVVQISNAIANSIENVKLYGKTTQFTTTGNNLFDKENAETVGGYVDPNGNVVGSASIGTTWFVPVSENTKYTISTNSPGGFYFRAIGFLDSEKSLIGFDGKDTNTYGTVFSGGQYVNYFATATFTTPKDCRYVQVGSLLSNWGSDSTIMLNYGDTALPYEPYTGGMASPNPDYPQALESVGASGAINTTVCGKNLVSVADLYVQHEPGLADVKQTDSVITLATNRYGDGFCFCENALKKGKSYVFSGHVENCVNVRIFMSRDDVIANTNYIEVPVDSSGNFNYVHTPAKDGAIFRIWVSGNVCTLTNFQVEEGYTATAYEPYKGGTVTASTPNGLPGIPVSSGGNYADENGQQWICDEIDFGRGVYVQRIAEICLDGSVPPNQYVQIGDAMRFGWTGKSGFTPKDYTNAELAMCNRFTPSVSPIWNNYLDGGICAHTGGNIYLRYDAVTSPEAMAEYLADNPVVYLYVMETPIETALSAEELAAFADLTNEPGTVTVYSEAALEVELSGIASSSAVTDAQKTANEAQGRADEAVGTLTEMQTTIQQLSDSIAMLVRDGTGGSMLKQDANGLWYFDISGIEKSISDTANDLGTLDGIVRDANGEIDVLKSTADALQQRTEYVRSYTDENDQPCLELGEGDSVFKVRITNTEIQFAEGSDVPAKLNRKMLVIEKAMVKDELQFGDDEVMDGVWIWKRRENGNLGLSWKTVR